MVLEDRINKNKISPEGIALLNEIAGQSADEFVHVDDDKRYIAAALARTGYLERNGQDVRLTDKGRKAAGIAPTPADLNAKAARTEEDFNRVIMAAEKKTRSAVAPATPLPEFGEGQGAGLCPPACDANCLHLRALELIFERYPHLREILPALRTIDKALEKR